MYVISGIGYVRSREQQEIFDQIKRLNATGARWNRYYAHPTATVRTFQEFLNSKLARLDLQIEEDGRYSWSVCAAIDALYGGAAGADMKKEMGCAAKYPVGKGYRDYLTDLRDHSAVPIPAPRKAPARSFCEPRPSMCFDSRQVKDSAQTKCQFTVTPREVSGGCGPARMQSRIGPYDSVDPIKLSASAFRPCDIQDLPVCPQTLVDWRRSRGLPMPGEEPVEVVPQSPLQPELPLPPFPELEPETPIPIAPPTEDLEEPVPVLAPLPAPAPAPSGDILGYTDLQWGMQNRRTAKLIQDIINPRLVQAGYEPMPVDAPFATVTCAAIQMLWGSQTLQRFQCGGGSIPNPEQFFRRGTSGVGQTDLPVFLRQVNILQLTMVVGAVGLAIWMTRKR